MTDANAVFASTAKHLFDLRSTRKLMFAAGCQKRKTRPSVSAVATPAEAVMVSCPAIVGGKHPYCLCYRHPTAILAVYDHAEWHEPGVGTCRTRALLRGLPTSNYVSSAHVVHFIRLNEGKQQCEDSERRGLV